MRPTDLRGRRAWLAARAALAGLMLVASTTVAAAASEAAGTSVRPPVAHAVAAAPASAVAGSVRSSAGGPERVRAAQVDAADDVQRAPVPPGAGFASLTFESSSAHPAPPHTDSARAPPAEGSA